MSGIAGSPRLGLLLYSMVFAVFDVGMSVWAGSTVFKVGVDLGRWRVFLLWKAAASPYFASLSFVGSGGQQAY